MTRDAQPSDGFRLPPRSAGVWRYTALDLAPVLAAVAHLAFVVWIVLGFSTRPWWGNLACGLVYAWAIAWNINGVSHNFLHTPYFRHGWANRAFSLLESLAIGFSQTIYRAIHLAHHSGNSDLPDAQGRTRDPLSIYKHGHGGAPEPLWRYVVLGTFRDDMPEVFSEMRRKQPADALFARIEIAAFAILVLGALLIDWRAVLFLLPFYFIGQGLSQLSGYYEHLHGNPARPIAWGVSSYQRLYNIVWFGNGYHGEHHYRPQIHWTRLRRFHESIADEQAAAGAHVIATSHLLGWLDRGNRRLGTGL